MTKDEALTIEALKYAASKGYGRIVRENSAPFTIKEALAQPAQETAHCQCTSCKDGILHASDCAVHNGPAYPAGPCDCGVAQQPDMQTGIAYQKGFHDGKQTALAQPAQEPAQLAHIAQFMKELRPAIGPMAAMGKSKTTQEWFDIVINEIERLQATQENHT